MAKGKYARKRLLKQFREIPIKESTLSAWIIKSFERAGFETLADVIACSEDKVKSIPGIGDKALVEICEFKKQALNNMKKGGQRNV